MNRNIDVGSCLHNIRIFPNDVVMLHGNAGVAAQLPNLENKDALNYLIKQLLKYFEDQGTLVVPTFSYSFTKKEDYDIIHSKSRVGQFSESFRKFPGVVRSRHPIFSVASIGRYALEFKNSFINDCFGKGSAFDLLNKL